MPAVVSTAYLSDEDPGAIMAYLQTVPPVDHELQAIWHYLQSLPKLPQYTE